jgi:RND family efflux transporter MFP subunit
MNKKRNFHMKRIICSVFFIYALSGACAFSASFEGIVRPMHELELAVPIDGIVGKRFVKEGDSVTKGGSILQLDDTLQKLEVDRKKQVYLDNAEYESNKSNLEIIGQLLESSRKLYENTGSVSLDEVNSLQMQYFNLKGKVEGHESKKKQELIEYEMAREVLARYTLRSPIDGTVAHIKPEEGEWIKAGEMLVVVADTSLCRVDFDVEERYARTLKKGNTVSFTVNQGAGVTARKGSVIFVSPVADKASALVKVKVEFVNKDPQVTPGVLANIRF